MPPILMKAGKTFGQTNIGLETGRFDIRMHGLNNNDGEFFFFFFSTWKE